MYKFTKIRDPKNIYDDTKVDFEVEATTLTEIIDAFEHFLRGCGFGIDGTLDIVKETNAEDIPAVAGLDMNDYRIVDRPGDML